MKVVSLLPAGTEIVAALGAAGSLVGISHECDYPPEVLHLPRVTTTPVDGSRPSAEIDRAVREARSSGRPVIAVEEGPLRELAPDLILTQGVCEVCAVAEGEVRRLAGVLDPAPRVVSLGAKDLGGIWSDIRAVGDALDLADEAEELELGLRARLERLARRAANGPRPRVVCAEWLDPPYLAGHWVPELVSAAGGEDVGAAPGSASVRREWSDVEVLRPDLLLLMPCGFGVERARQEIARLAEPAAIRLIQRVPTWIIDANAFTSRPGPRVVDGAELIHCAIVGEEREGIERWEVAW